MLLLSLLVFGASSPARVELPAAASVFAAGQDTLAEGEAGRVELEFFKALKKKKTELVDLGALYPPPAAPPTDEADKLFAAGKEAYDNLDFEGATRALTDAAVYFIKHPTAATPEQLSEIFLFLGASELQNGAKAAAQKEFTRALQMNPSLAPDNKYFGTDVQALFAAAQKEMGKRKKGTLSVESVPAGAQVDAFGLSYGLTPVAEIELPAGRYMVQLTRPGFTPTAAFPEVVAGQSSAVRQKLEAAPETIALRAKAEKLITRAVFDAGQLDPAALEIARAAKGRYLVMLAVSSAAKAPAAVEAQVWNPLTGDRLTGVKFAADADGYEAGAEAVHAWITRPGQVVPVAEVEAEGPRKSAPMQPSGGDSVFKQWWFWTAVGVVAVGGVSAGVVAAQPRGSRGFNVVLGQP